ncbi:MAG: hypothetical protein NTW87_12200, partial [Planctomycetota bacterium]|nr:hypothetical protein [Planctomycetota bacterium]
RLPDNPPENTAAEPSLLPFSLWPALSTPSGKPVASDPKPILFLSELPAAAVTCTAAGADVDLTFDLAGNAPLGPVRAYLVFRDMARRELSRVAVTADVLPQYLVVDAPLAFGPVEAGDTATRLLRWQWAMDLHPSGQGEKLQPPLRALLQLLPDTAQAPPVTLSPPELAGGFAQSRFTLALPRDAEPGEISGRISIEAGPVLAFRRWSAQVVQPRLAVDPPALDFGALLPGQSRKCKTVLRADTAKPVAVSASAPPFSKPRVAGITLPADSMKLSRAQLDIAPNGSEELTLDLNVPDKAQDGLYRTALSVSSRLGTVTLPVSLTVINDVAPAAFHAEPSVLVLRFDPTPQIPVGRVRIVSHRDEDIVLALQMKPYKAETSDAPAPQEQASPLAASLLLATAGSEKLEPRTGATVALPARATILVLLQARPDSQAGEMACLHISGADEDQLVEVRIERVTAPQMTEVTQSPRMLDWLLLAFVGVMLLLAVVARFTVKRPWVRFVTYSILFHMGFLPWAMPRQRLMDALPASMQISLLESETLMGMTLSDQQARRLEALRFGEEPGPPGAPPAVAAVALGTPVLDRGVPLPDGGAKPDAPTATALEPARAGDEGRADLAAAPQPQRVAVAGGLPDEPLRSDALPPDPGPAPAAKVQEPSPVQPCAIMAPPAVAFDDAPLPAIPLPRRATPPAAIGNAVPARASVIEEPDAPLRADLVPVARPARTQAGAQDAPLATDILPPVPTARPAAAAGNGEAPGRAAPVVAATPRAGSGGAAGGPAIGAVADSGAARVRSARAGEVAPLADAGGEPGPVAVAQPVNVARPGGGGGGADLLDAPLDAGPGLPAVSAPGGGDRSQGIAGGAEGVA